MTQRRATGLASTVGLLAPSIAFAQKIPDSVVWAAGMAVVAPILAMPVKRLVGTLFGVEIPVARLWGLCAADWLLWLPGTYLLFITVGFTGTGIGLLAVFGLSAWLHRPKPAVGSRLAVGPILALLTPAIALAGSLVFLAN